MFNLFDKSADYDTQKKQAESDNRKDRLNLARNPRTHLEILYYLAADEDKDVRQAVAGNKSTPMQAAPLLAQDKDVDIRLELMRRLVGLLPELSNEQHAKLYAFAVQALGYLALDEVLKVRLALSSALRDHANAPPEVVSALARDAERAVAEPILRYCMALPDKDLLDILGEHPEPWVVETVAQRVSVSAALARAVAAERNGKANRFLLQNSAADLDDDTLQGLILDARNHPDWHKPLVLRKHLPPPFVKEILNFVDARLQKKILERPDFTPELREELKGHVKRRLTFLTDEIGRRVVPEEKADALFKAGRLDEQAVLDALALREAGFVKRALALRARVSNANVERVMALRAAKPLMALVWKAELGMPVAFAIQKDVLHLMPRELIYPKSDQAYPLSREELVWQLEFLDLA